MLPVTSVAQTNPLYSTPTKQGLDSIRLVLQETKNDTIRMEILRTIANYNFWVKVDSTIDYEEQALVIARQLKLKLWEADIMDLLGASLNNSGEYTRALQMLLAAQKIAEDEHIEENIWNIDHFTNNKNPVTARLNLLAAIHIDKCGLYSTTKNRHDALKSIVEGKDIAERNRDSTILSMVYAWIGISQGNSDSALINLQNSLLCAKASDFKFFYSEILNNFARFYLRKGDFIQAKKYILEGLDASKLQQNAEAFIGTGYKLFSDYFSAVGIPDSALLYATKALQKFQSVSVPGAKLIVYQSLAALYKLNRQPDSAFHYMQLAFSLNDSLNNSEKVRQFQNIGFNELLRVEQLEKDKIELQNAIRIYAMFGGLIVFSIIAFFLYRNNLSRKKANELLQKQKDEIGEQKQQVDQTLTELRSTQAQLIQSEKMASLGELTAGIAHEIQNPLNFVNNFSEVNNELIKELKNEVINKNLDEISTIANDIESNSEKILQHGKRADGIVKGMLQHSQKSLGVKEPTDINALANEYFRMAYHSFQSKNKDSAEINLITDFDPGLPLVNVIQQDIGKALFNLLNNAFWAVNEKHQDLNKKNSVDKIQSENNQELGSPEFASNSGGRGKEESFENYHQVSPPTPKGENISALQPTVTLTTKNLTDHFEIRIRDNGLGIPSHIINKIFQPFFTTKPTGQGTGLGLSMAYDIITKVHQGTIKVNSSDQGSEFTISLPIN
jgi:two-component system, NtrC family, sensor kinase